MGHGPRDSPVSGSDSATTGAGSLRRDVRRVNNVLPDDQQVVLAEPGMPAREALAIMAEGGFSQLPIATSQEVVGVFSYRSFARGVANQQDERDIASLPVSEFVEDLKYVRTSDPFDE